MAFRMDYERFQTHTPGMVGIDISWDATPEEIAETLKSAGYESQAVLDYTIAVFEEEKRKHRDGEKAI